MRRLLRADFARLWKSAAFWLTLGGMFALAGAFMVMQATAMSYSVPLSRVVFLPLSLYGVAMAAFVSLFVGADFSGGFLRNKLLAVKSRNGLVLSHVAVSGTACLLIYGAVTVFTWAVGRIFFANNVEMGVFLPYFLLGLGMSGATAALFAVLTLLCGNRTRAVLLCMGIAVGLLFLALHTNSVLVQTEYRDGVLNPHYVGGVGREIYGFLHDLNPCGQAAQLSSWQIPHLGRCLFLDLILTAGSVGLGCVLFRRKELR